MYRPRYKKSLKSKNTASFYKAKNPEHIRPGFVFAYHLIGGPSPRPLLRPM